MYARRRLALLLTLILLAVVLSLRVSLFDAVPLDSRTRHPFAGLPWPSTAETTKTSRPLEGRLFGLFSQALVVSRPTRFDRRATMERLRLALGVSWTYVDATSHDEPVIAAIMDCVRSVRRNTRSRDFQWPPESELDALVRGPPAKPSLLPASSAQSCFPLPVRSSLQTTSPYAVFSPIPTSTALRLSSTSSRDQAAIEPLTCAKEDRVHGVKYRPSLLSYMLLTPAKIACWYSHLAAIQRIADLYEAGRGSDGVTATTGANRDAYLVLEDDVDMEQSISTDLEAIWPLLPVDWDIIFLGHCWSNESHYPAVGERGESSTGNHQVRLHPSFAPKCTHAYALSPVSARLLLSHLTYPPFAYSRALDQALSWLVQSRRLKAFSVVPSLIVQHKVSGSDIDQGADGTGSKWRDHLEHGILGL